MGLMPKRFNASKRRVGLSWAFGIVFGAGIFFTEGKWEGFPVVATVLYAIGIFLASIASLGRLWCMLYIAGRKQKVLVDQGPYSICRHPLYFFSFLGAAGVGLATETFLWPLVIVFFFSLYYPSVIRREEEKLSAIFGETFNAYRQTTPCFWPRWARLVEPDEYMVRPRIFRHHLFDALWFIWIVGIMEVINGLHQTGIIPILFRVW